MSHKSTDRGTPLVDKPCRWGQWYCDLTATQARGRVCWCINKGQLWLRPKLKSSEEKTAASQGLLLVGRVLEHQMEGGNILIDATHVRLKLRVSDIAYHLVVFLPFFPQKMGGQGSLP